MGDSQKAFHNKNNLHKWKTWYSFLYSRGRMIKDKKPFWWAHGRLPKRLENKKVAFQIIKKPLVPQSFSTCGITMCGNLIKPVENEDFWVPFPHLAPKFHKNIRFSVKVDGVLRRRKTLINSTENTIPQKSKTRCRKPYKTCWNLVILDALLRKGT